MRRKTSQDLLPLKHEATPDGQYDIYPAYPIGDGKINIGYQALADQIKAHKRIVIDGYVGVFRDDMRHELDKALSADGLNITWF